MAEEFVAANVIALLEKAIAAAADRIGLVPGFKDELIKMEGLVRDIQARVADVEGKKFQNPIVLRWLKDFKGAILEAEIVLDELHYEDLRREVHKFKRGPAAKIIVNWRRARLEHMEPFQLNFSPESLTWQTVCFV